MVNLAGFPKGKSKLEDGNAMNDSVFVATPTCNLEFAMLPI